jgi:hypothetical protein
MLTESRIREVLAALPDLLAEAKEAGDEHLPVDRRSDATLMDAIAEPLAARLTGGERSVALIRDLQRIVEIHGFLSGAGTLESLRERFEDPAWSARVAELRPEQATLLAEGTRLLSDRVAQIPPEEEAAVRACHAEITATMARLAR